MEIKVEELEALNKQLEKLGSTYELSLLPQLRNCRDRLEQESAMTRNRYYSACSAARNKYQQELRQYYENYNQVIFRNGVCMTPPPEMQKMPELDMSRIVQVLTLLDDNINSIVGHMSVLCIMRDTVGNLVETAGQIDTDAVSLIDKTGVADISTQAVIAGVSGYISAVDTPAFKYKDKWGRVHTNYGTEAIASSMVENNVSSSCIDTWAKKVGWTDEQVEELHTAYDFAVSRNVHIADELMSDFADSAYIMGADVVRYGIMRQADEIRKNEQNVYSGDITGALFVHDCYSKYCSVPNSYELWGHYGYKVDELDDLKTGDVMVFSDVVGLYVKDDNVILNDTTMGGVSVRPLSDLEVWHGGLVSCRRIIDEEEREV